MEKRTIKISNNWSEVTLKERLELEKIYSNEELEPEIKTLKAIALLSHEDESTINSISFQDFATLASNLEFLKSSPEFKVPKKITVDGVVYNVISDLTNITTAQYFDFTTLMKQYSESNDEDTLYKMVALFLIPESKKYLDGYDIEDVASIVPNISYGAVQGLISFFIRCRQKFIEITLNYLLNQIPKKQRMELKKQLKKNKIPHTTLLETLVQLQKSQDTILSKS